MKLPNWIRILIWLGLFLFISYLLSQRYSAIVSGIATATDIIIFLIWIALIASMIFPEVDIFGVRLKREINNLRTDFKEQVTTLRSEIHNTITTRTEISPRIYFPSPPTDAELPSIEERIKPILDRALQERGIKPAELTPSEQLAPDNTQYLFSVRYAIETELRRILKPKWEPRERRQYMPTIRLARILHNMSILSSQYVDAITEVYAICSAAIHGEDISEKAIDFVRDIAPSLIAALGVIEAVEQIEWSQPQPDQ